MGPPLRVSLACNQRVTGDMVLPEVCLRMKQLAKMNWQKNLLPSSLGLLSLAEFLDSIELRASVSWWLLPTSHSLFLKLLQVLWHMWFPNRGESLLCNINTYIPSPLLCSVGYKQVTNFAHKQWILRNRDCKEHSESLSAILCYCKIGPADDKAWHWAEAIDINDW